ncbi:hypothetical protein Taro_047998 [Colocasia esculenta]|uniref:Cupin type-1 domain-containing protein n=1 Tax=Colocasia esculenta TaxID=4460 RepID=A0A843X615_COLES|nr:hypothetical protein [Colocasia esculenta]
MARAAWDSPFFFFFVLVLILLLLPWSPSSSSSCSAATGLQVEAAACPVPLVTRENRKTIASTESGTITSVDIDDGYRGTYHLQFFTLEPQSLLLPLLLHTDMVFYVHSGRGTVSWVDEGETYDLEVESGDVYRIGSGCVIYMRSHPDPLREKLRVYAIFSTIGSEVSPAAMHEAFVGAYSNVSDLVRGFDEAVLRMGFRVPAEVISGLKKAEKTPPIVPLAAEKETEAGLNWKEGIFEALTGGSRPLGPDNGKKVQKKKKKKTKTKAFNIVKAEPDVENCNGRSIAVTDEDLDALLESDIGVFMVNLTKGSMMGPHWNPFATEIAVVTHGRGMVQLVLPSVGAAGEIAAACQSLRFRANVGDVFLVPRYHPMAQMSFNDDYLSFVGFSTRVSKNHPQFLAGKRSVLQTLNKGILALSLGVPNATVEQLLVAQEDAIMLECTSCAEEEERKMEAEIQRQKEEEARKREEEEEARRREEEEAKKREEEEAARRQEEEAREREEEEKRRQQEEEEERRRQEEEEEGRGQEEERQRREEEAREREEEEKRKQQEEEEERRRQEEEEEARRQEEERQRREEQERARREEEEGAGGGGERERFKPWRLPMV